MPSKAGITDCRVPKCDRNCSTRSTCAASTSVPGRCSHAGVAFKQYARWVTSSVRLHLLMPLTLLRLYGRQTLSFEVLTSTDHVGTILYDSTCLIKPKRYVTCCTKIINIEMHNILIKKFVLNISCYHYFRT